MLASAATMRVAASHLAAVFGPWLLRLDDGYLSQFGLLLLVSMHGSILCSAGFMSVWHCHLPKGLR
jgi:hypothetical protein